jgi:glycine/D-amino acid oxidase-like deaminating enzyme
MAPLDTDETTDIAIIGGGIAGIATAYFILAKTGHAVTLIEADRLAHGATGHNAGYVTGYFEKPFRDIVTKYGLERAAEAQRAVWSAWDLLDDIFYTTGLKTPYFQFTGYAGCSSREQLLGHLENKYLRHKAGINVDQVYVAAEAPWKDNLPRKYQGLYHIMPQDNILSYLETKDRRYLALLATRKGTLNSALFTEELAAFMLEQFAGRFRIYEGTYANEIKLSRSGARVETPGGTVSARKVVLCTNGFENFSIRNEHGSDIDARFHSFVYGIVSYMAGYVEPLDKPPTAISYFPDPTDDPNAAYYYLTRRPYDMGDKRHTSLVYVGGPEMLLPEKVVYRRKEHVYEEATLKEIDAFLRATYRPFPRTKPEYVFHWHGLMGYTKNHLRLLGAEPCNRNLLYNLGCNGVGILPSIFGGKHIARIIAGETVERTVFDPLDTRCVIK